MKSLRLGGHPIHLLLIHFPSALYPFSAVMDWLAYLTSDGSFALASYYAFIGAFSGAAAAAIFGAIDFLSLPAKHAAWKTAALHGGLNLLWIFAFAALLGFRSGQSPAQIQAPGYLVTFSIFTVAMFYSNWLGGELVLRHGVGHVTEEKKE